MLDKTRARCKRWIPPSKCERVNVRNEVGWLGRISTNELKSSKFFSASLNGLLYHEPRLPLFLSTSDWCFTFDSRLHIKLFFYCFASRAAVIVNKKWTIFVRSYLNFEYPITAIPLVNASIKWILLKTKHEHFLTFR